jgi:Domain of unknown function (DUF4129)
MRISAVANGQAGSGSATAPADVRTTLAGRYVRVIITGLLLLVVMAGVRVAAPAVAGRGPLRQDALALGIAGEVALAALEVALFVRARRSPLAGQQAVVIRKGLQFISALIMVAIVAIAGINVLVGKQAGHIMEAIRGSTKTPKPTKLLKEPPLTPVSLGYLVYIALGLVVLAAVVVCVWLVLQRRRSLARAGPGEPVSEDAEQLRQAVESGRAALGLVDDARAAIIACYVAMEGSLERAGTARGVAETPDELLARATASSLLRGPAASRLTVLFYEARFSTHDLPGTAKDDARHALDAISAELADPDSPASPADAARPGGPAGPVGLAADGAGR